MVHSAEPKTQLRGRWKAQGWRQSRAVAIEQFENYERWAAKVALEMHSRLPAKFEVEDLVQLAKLGLWKASIRFDPTSPVRFPVYAATWVKGEILMATRRGQALNAAMKSVEALGSMAESEPELSLRLEELSQGLSERSRRLLRLLREGHTIGEIAARAGVTRSDVEALIERLKREAGVGTDERPVATQLGPTPASAPELSESVR